MDSNGLADPYVKLHLLPGASKVKCVLSYIKLSLILKDLLLCNKGRMAISDRLI